MVYVTIFLLLFFVGLPLFNILVWKLSGADKAQRVLAISHRGAAGLAPENTLEAMDYGLQYNASVLEIDIRQTIDHEIVVIHDKTVDRTTNGKGLVHKLSYAEIEKLDASISFPEFPAPTKIPSLVQVLEKIKNTDTKLLIEIKDPELYPGMISRLIKTIHETNTENNILVFSFKQKVLTEVKHGLPGVPTGIFYVGVEKVNDSLKVEYVSPNWITLLYFPFLIKRLHAKGYKIFVWTVDAAFIMRYLIGKNVDGIITNRPDRLNNSLLNLN